MISDIGRTWIPTFTGGKFDPLRPEREAIDIRDIAHSLANMARFTGHTRRMYSVAQHCIQVSETCSDPRYGLLHDASEAYLVDVASPIKHTEKLSGYREIERIVQSAVYSRFGLSIESEPPDLHEQDARWCATEMRDLLPPGLPLRREPFDSVIVPMSSSEAERAFLERFVALFPSLSLGLFPERATWDHTWMSVARQIAQRSYDPRTRVGAVIVSADNTMVLSLGYNGNYSGGPNAVDSVEPGKSGTVHAELNAVIKLDYHDHRERVMYVTHSPCVECAKCIVNARVKRVVYESAYRDARGLALLRSAGVDVRRYVL